MDLDRSQFLIPTRLDDPPKALFWDFDIAAVFVIGVSLGIMVGFLSLGFLVGIGGAYAWSRMRTGRHPGYAMHSLYWALPLRMFRRTPPSSRRRFVG